MGKTVGRKTRHWSSARDPHWRHSRRPCRCNNLPPRCRQNPHSNSAQPLRLIIRLHRATSPQHFTSDQPPLSTYHAQRPSEPSILKGHLTTPTASAHYFHLLAQHLHSKTRQRQSGHLVSSDGSEAHIQDRGSSRLVPWRRP